MKKGISPWFLTTRERFKQGGEPIWSRTFQDFSFEVDLHPDSLWVVAVREQKRCMAMRAAYTPAGDLQIIKTSHKGTITTFHLHSSIGGITVKLEFPEEGLPLVRCTSILKPTSPLTMPFWPRDLLPLQQSGESGQLQGKVHASQVGIRSGLLYFSMEKPALGSVFYFQNLSALNDYFEATHTSAADTVGGEWPELGFALPPAKEEALPAEREVTLSDFFALFNTTVPADEFQMSRQFLDMLAQVYLHLPVPKTEYPDWPGIAVKSLRDLQDCPGCWSHTDGHSFLNAYLSDYKSPPESMVQLAVLLPLLEYAKWCGEDLPIVKKIEKGLPLFFDNDIKCMVRWLPSKAEELDGSEEHKKPRVMDSWYLHHPLLNLSRMALKGDKAVEKLFLDSLDYVIKVARHFDYQWPVFYDLDTLEIIKAETKPGEGGEKDVAGSYAHIMLQAWELTKEKRYLEEAELAAKALVGNGFELFYQANNTAFTAGAMLQLWKITNEDLYLDLSNLCIANLFKNMLLWECNYGHGKFHPSFFALFPLKDAPYTAVYEELEGFAAFSHFLALSEGAPVRSSVKLLLPEFIRLMSYKAMFYYPPMLPEEMLAKEVKTGELDPKLWIPIEDMQDGWENCGSVGQEVYGAGLGFGILTRQYMRIPDAPFMVFIDYPTLRKKIKKGGPVSFQVCGDPRLCCRLRLIPEEGQALPTVTLSEDGENLIEKRTKEGHLEYQLKGNSNVVIEWKTQKKAKKTLNGKKKLQSKK